MYVCTRCKLRTRWATLHSQQPMYPGESPRAACCPATKHTSCPSTRLSMSTCRRFVGHCCIANSRDTALGESNVQVMHTRLNLACQVRIKVHNERFSRIIVGFSAVMQQVRLKLMCSVEMLLYAVKR